MVSRLKELRKEKKVTLADIEKQTGIKRSTYSDYENGVVTTGKLATWLKLADFFDVDVAYLQGTSRFKNAQESREAWHSLRVNSADYHSSYLDRYNDEINKQKDFYSDLFGQIEKNYLNNQTPIKNLNDKQKEALAYLFDNIINQAEQLAQLQSDRADLFISRSIVDSKEFKKALHHDNDDDAYDIIGDR